ncbi:hypothetical protein [Rhodococcus qingshengii]|uniref:hypothetical protein n=1 Tax=Rhodococcus qingshengii TaxID=334542 RepID=UPI001C8CC117|nr:hypothetical protein [Rhodococcus qingshengii]MBX9151981.1 hypothetical protein [Rhodococcus qingshengii]
MTTGEGIDGLEHDLIENGLSFLRRSVDGMHASSGDDHAAAFAVVDLAVAVEVLLKARLCREHWSLICSDPDKATPAKLLAGSLKTVTPAQAVERLDGIAELPMKANSHPKRVDEIGQLRNRAVHLTLTSRGQLTIAVQAEYGRALSFVLWLLDTQFRGQMATVTEALVEAAIEALTRKVGEFDDLVAERMQTIAGELDAAAVCVECPRCRQSTLQLTEGETVRCALCLWAPHGGEAALEYIEGCLGLSEYRTVVKDGGYWPPIDWCPQCGEHALVEDIAQLRPAPAKEDAGSLNCDAPVAAYWGCFGCGMTAGYSELDRCGRCPTIIEFGSSVCNDCMSSL